MQYGIPICKKCKWLFRKKGPLQCEAFNKSIPDDILWRNIGHSKPLEGQDNDIVFEPIGD